MAKNETKCNQEDVTDTIDALNLDKDRERVIVIARLKFEAFQVQRSISLTCLAQKAMSNSYWQLNARRLIGLLAKARAKMNAMQL